MSDRSAREGSRLVRLIAATAAVCLVGALASPAGADPIGPGDFEDPPVIQGPQPVVKWSMPERFDDSPSVGVPAGDPVDPLDQEFQDYIRPPQGWSVSVDGCSSFSDGGATVVDYEWTLSGTLGNIVRFVPRSDDCTSRLNGLALGFYDLTLKVWDSGGLAVARTERIELKDLVIAVAGDSMASGEGNPEIPGNVRGGVISQWVDADCDRSSRSGHARAAREIEQRDPQTSVTYINVACTGATTAQMLDQPWPGVLDDNRWHPPQLRHLGAAVCDDAASRDIRQDRPDPLTGAATWGAFAPDCERNDSRPIHSLFLTVGVNDIGFRDVLFACGDLNFEGWAAIEDAVGWLDQAIGGVFSSIWGDILPTGCDDNETTNAGVSAGLDAIRDTSEVGVFPRMAALLDGSAMVVDPQSGGGVYQTMYPHRVFTETSFDDCGGVFSRIDDDEIVYLDVVNQTLNQELRRAANRVGWYPSPLFRDDAWVGHGYCEPTSDRWFVSLTESVSQYNNIPEVTIEGEDERPITFGILHPNAAGHDNIRRMIMEEWVERSRPITNTVSVDFLDIRIEDALTYVRPESELPPFLVFDLRASRIGLDGESARWEQTQDVVVPLTWEPVGANQWRMVPETTLLGQSFDVELNEAESMVVEVTGAFPSISDEVECPPTPGSLAVTAAAPGDGGGGGGGGGTCTVGIPRGVVIGDTYVVGDGEGFGAGATYTEESLDPFTTEGRIVVRYSISDPNAPQPPVADAGGPYVADEGSNGGVLQLDGTGSTDPDGDPAALSYEWTGATVTPADSPTPTFDATDDAEETVTLTVTDPDDLTASDTTSIEVRNVSPTVTLTGASIDEGETVTLEGTFSDPGVADTHTGTVDWADDGADPAAITLSPTDPGSGTFTVSRTLGDDGSFEVTVSVTDDDGGTGSATATVQVANLDPSVTVSGDSTELPGGEGIFTTPGVASTISVQATDPGSDDLTFTWPEGGASTEYNDGIGPDPDPSPGPVFPFSAGDDRGLSFTDIGVHPVPVTASDDDGGASTGSVVVLVTGTYQHEFGFGQWRNRFTGKKDDIPVADLQGMIGIVAYASSVFGVEAEGIPLGSLQAAAGVLDNPTPDRRSDLSQALLAAWLDVASGAVEWSDTVGNRGETVGSLVTAAESVWWDPLATDQEISSARSSLMPI